MIGFGNAERRESLVTASLIGVISVTGFFLGFGLYPSIGLGVIGMLITHSIWWKLNGYSFRQIYLPLNSDEIDTVYGDDDA